MKNYYEILNVVNFAEVKIIKATYRILVKKYHPDVNKNVDPNIIVHINEAYEVLSNPTKKKIYDEKLKEYLEQQKSYNNKSVEKNEQKEDVYCDKKVDFNIFRILISLIVGIVFGIISSFLLMTIIPFDGSWSFIGYTIYGYLVGVIIKSISKSNSSILGGIGFCITIVCMALPYYLYLFDIIPLVNGNMSDFELFLKSTKEIVDIFLGSGIIRLLFSILTPIFTFSTITD